MEPSKVGKRGTVLIPAALRKRCESEGARWWWPRPPR